MTRITFVKIVVALLIVLLLAAASAILIRSNAGTTEPKPETPGGVVH